MKDSMEYLAKVHHEGHTYEAYVTVTHSTWSRTELDSDFGTSFCFVDDAVETLEEHCSGTVQLMLLDDACDQYIAEWY